MLPCQSLASKTKADAVTDSVTFRAAVNSSMHAFSRMPISRFNLSVGRGGGRPGQRQRRGAGRVQGRGGVAAALPQGQAPHLPLTGPPCAARRSEMTRPVCVCGEARIPVTAPLRIAVGACLVRRCEEEPQAPPPTPLPAHQRTTGRCACALHGTWGSRQ